MVEGYIDPWQYPICVGSILQKYNLKIDYRPQGRRNGEGGGAAFYDFLHKVLGKRSEQFFVKSHLKRPPPPLLENVLPTRLVHSIVSDLDTLTKTPHQSIQVFVNFPIDIAIIDYLGSQFPCIILAIKLFISRTVKNIFEAYTFS